MPPVTPPQSPQEAYARHRADAQAALARLDRQAGWLANVRGVLFLGAIVLVAMILFGKAPRSAWGPVGGAAVLYAIAAVVHARVLANEARARLRVALNDRALARLDGRWRSHARTGEAFAGDDLASSDLDLFGPASLFQLITEAVTRDGEARLAEVLRGGVEAPGAHQEAIRDLTPRLAFRQAFSVETQVASGLGVDGSGLVRWAESSAPLARVAWARFTPYVLPPLVLALFLLGRAELVPRGAYIPALLLQLAVVRLTMGAFTAVYGLLSRGERGFVRWEAAFREVEGQAFQAPHLVELTRGFRPPGEERVSQRLARLGRLFLAVEIRQSGLVYALLAFGLLWDVHFFFRLERWRVKHGASVRGWVQALAQMESLCSLAAFAHAYPELPYPAIAPEGPRFEAQGLAHPLLDAPVPNDVALPAPGTALIVTGSNMSGKSTLLRAMGVNAVLARAGAPVRATALRMAPLRVVTSMRVKDSLERGVSYFYAEVERLKAVLDAAQAAHGQVLFLLDEMLLGTNTRERQIASREVLRMLLATGAIGAVTTHDLSLTTLETSAGMRIHNIHFQDVLQDGKLRFDYRLREGVVETTNALRVLRQAGIPVAES